MSNHLHLVCSAEENFKISNIIRDFKKFTLKNILNKIEEEIESSKNWMLYRFEYAGKYENRIKHGSDRCDGVSFSS